ncbi:MAG: T9SS type A sorting domain-containing protein [bacterium]|nr:T9SS type A sorting domain-containing protein [bacterium]
MHSKKVILGFLPTHSNEASATPTGVEGKPGAQSYSFFLMPPSPNPVKNSAEFRFGLAKDQQASLEIYNVLGQRVKTLVNGMLGAGNHTVKWNGCDQKGRKVSSGVYVYRLITGDNTSTRRLTVIR